MDVLSIIPTRFPEWGFSPWMSSILGHSLLRAYHTLSDVRAREILINLADCVSRRGVYFGPVGASVAVDNLLISARLTVFRGSSPEFLPVAVRITRSIWVFWWQWGLTCLPILGRHGGRWLPHNVWWKHIRANLCQPHGTAGIGREVARHSTARIRPESTTGGTRTAALLARY
jgi:hypothetical protein